MTNSSSKRILKNKGEVIIINTLLFLAISLVITFGIAGPVLANYTSTNAFVHSKESFLLANSAAEEALYRLRNNLELPSSETISLSSGEAEISVADTMDGKTVTIESESESFERNIEISITETEGVSFSYGLQVGQGGFQMSGGAGIYGNVYSNGDIIGSGGPFITGSATVANASDPVANQSNGTTTPPAYNLDFGSNSTPQDLAQSFQVSTSTPVSSIRFYIKKSQNQWQNNVTVRIVNNNSGNPGRTTLASATLSAAQVTTSYNYLSIPFTSNPVLTPGTTYWIVLDTSTTWGTNYSIGGSSDTYPNGLAKTGEWSSSSGGTWNNTSPSGLDAYFDIYVGGDTGLISGVTIGSAGGDAWAHEVNNSTISGTIYCQASSGNNKACDTSRPDPVEQPLPVSEGNINDWKAEAEDGGVTTGNLSYGGSQNVSLGPQKIIGNLSVGSGATLRITGTLWVTGNITLNGGGIIRLDPTFQGSSGIIVSDGRIATGGGGQFQGSGTSGSYILVITTSSCPTGSCGGNPAISVSGGSGSVVLNAQNGTLEFSGGASAKQATAKTIVMSGGTTVSYESGLADINFTSGPSGSWGISGWEEI